jgi:hypothetical protein
MASQNCAHKDIRQIDNLRCCISCGETLHLWHRQLSQRDQSSQRIQTDPSSPRLSHIYSDLSLSTGIAIRLIVLFPGSSSEPLCCTVNTANPHKEEYDAISYTWATEDGDDSKTGRIHCPDGVVAITENCEAALRQLRLRSTPRQLWVDAICIDQSNTKERNHQVGLMDQIFRSASTVHICIHDPGRRYKEFIEWLRTGTDPDSLIDPTSAIIQARELFRRRYFTRVWVSNLSTIVALFLLLSHRRWAGSRLST